MPELSFLTHVVRTLYGLEPHSIEALEPYGSDRRGIYRVDDPQQGAWMFRLSRSADIDGSLLHTGQLLHWLRRHHYLAPYLLRTTDQQLVGIVDDWAITVLTYVEGTPLGTHPADLGALAQTLGRLHTLPVDEQLVYAKSRCHPDTIATAAHQLATHRQNVPEEFHSLVRKLFTTMIALQQQAGPYLCITHGDCWYRNAIKTREGNIVLIDWDQSGIGLPQLDLGNVLLSSHFNFDQPLQIDVDASKIKAIVQGYQQQCPIRAQNREYLANTMRFLLAWQLGSYLADNRLCLHPDFPLVLHKLQARYHATGDIADIAVDYIR